MINYSMEPYFAVRSISMEDKDSLQQLCESCLDYYDIVEGRTPQADAAEEILTEMPPNTDKEDKFVLGIYNQDELLVGVVDLIRNFPAEGEWTIGLLMIDPRERGKGLGRRIHEGLVKDASDSGAKILRIGVAQDNHNAYGFWTSLNYTKIKEVEMKIGLKVSIINVMHYYINQ